MTPPAPATGTPPFPTALKLGWTLWVIVLIPFYAMHMGLANFLWFSDIALIGGCLALWMRWKLPASMMALMAAGLDLLWVLDGAVHLAGGFSPLGMTQYMTDPSIPLFSRLLSLFHVPLPVCLVLLVRHLGYDPRALAAQSAALPVILILSWALGSVEANINRVHGVGYAWLEGFPLPVWIGLECVFLVVGVYVPSHLILKRCFIAASPAAAPSDQRG